MLPVQAHQQLAALYAELAQALVPYERHCQARGLCCDFERTGHLLFVTGLEAAHMACGGLPPDPAQAAAGRCPFQRERHCGIRAHRALGCRLYFCDRTYEAERHALCEVFLRRIRQIEQTHQMSYAYQAVTRVNFEEYRCA